MNRAEHETWMKNRNQGMLLSHWPTVSRRLQEGMAPKEIAQMMSKEGYWGFSSNGMGVADIQRICELAATAGLVF